jgi:hypothetical protein
LPEVFDKHFVDPQGSLTTETRKKGGIDMRYMGLVIIFATLCIFTFGCPAKTPPRMTNPSGGEVVIYADQGGGAPVSDVPSPTAQVQPPPPSVGSVPQGLVRVVVTIPEEVGKIRYVITDVGFQPIYPATDGKVYLDLTPNDHQINVATLEWKWAVENNTAQFPVFCNGIRLTRVRLDPNGGMYYFYVWPTGQIGTNPP